MVNIQLANFSLLKSWQFDLETKLTKIWFRVSTGKAGIFWFFLNNHIIEADATGQWRRECWRCSLRTPCLADIIRWLILQHTADIGNTAAAGWTVQSSARPASYRLTRGADQPSRIISADLPETICFALFPNSGKLCPAELLQRPPLHYVNKKQFQAKWEEILKLPPAAESFMRTYTVVGSTALLLHITFSPPAASGKLAYFLMWTKFCVLVTLFWVISEK